MTDQRDSSLQTLFADAEQDLTSDAFTSQVMTQADGLNRRAIALRVGLALALALCLWLLAGPLQQAVFMLTHSLTLSLINPESHLLSQLLLPVNNIAALIALGLISGRLAYRKIFA